MLRIRSYAGKFLLLSFVAAHIPLLTLAGYLLFVLHLNSSTTWTSILLALMATLTATGVAFARLWVLLAPVSAASSALTVYRVEGERALLPTDCSTRGGWLLANVQVTLDHFDHLDDVIEDLQESASRDEFTGVYNRRDGHRRLETMMRASRSEGSRLSLTVIDADGLKQINDTWGHTAGDTALRHLSESMAREIGDAGWTARWGGDEFILIIQEHDGVAVAEDFVERVLKDLEDRPVQLEAGGQFVLKSSAGTSRAELGDDPVSLFKRADEMLYRAKQARAQHLSSI